MPANLALVRRLALALPAVTEGRCYGTPGFYVKKKLMLRMWPDGETLVTRASFEQRDRLLAAEPNIFFLTDHYRDHTSVLVRLAAVDEPKLREIIEQSWQFMAPPKIATARRRAATPKAAHLDWSIATADDADALTALRNAVAADLTARHGRGAWSGQCTARGVLADMRDGKLLLGRRDSEILATLRLATRKPWAIDRSYFTPVLSALYLTNLAIAPAHQRRGLGRLVMAEAASLARTWPADSICLDAFDHPTAGAGEFYRKCGYREVGRVTYRGVPLRYYELLL